MLNTNVFVFHELTTTYKNNNLTMIASQLLISDCYKNSYTILLAIYSIKKEIYMHNVKI